MFTGIVEAVGVIAAKEEVQGDLRLYLRTGRLDLADVKLGDSIAVNGVCLTVVDLPGDGFFADLSRETLAHTLFGTLPPGSRVNLEKALRLDTRLGGHIVSGHVDGVGQILAREEDARSIRYRVALPAELRRYVAGRGSITVDGTSLTVTDVDESAFHLNIVPHTAAETIVCDYQVGREVHLEVDLIARYLERLMGFGPQQGGEHSAAGGLTLEKLASYGFSGR